MIFTYGLLIHVSKSVNANTRAFLNIQAKTYENFTLFDKQLHIF